MNCKLVYETGLNKCSKFHVSNIFGYVKMTTPSQGGGKAILLQ
jgi:hypothetical protein